MKHILLLLCSVFMTAYPMAFSSDPEKWTDGGESYWCNKTKAELLLLFQKTLHAIEIEHEIARKRDHREDNSHEWKQVHKYQDEFFWYPTSNMANKFRCCVTKQKIEAYLEASQSTPNEPLPWPHDPQYYYNDSLLQSMTRQAIEEKRVWKSTRCAVKPLEHALRLGGNLHAHNFEGDLSPLETAYFYKTEAQTYIHEHKNSNDHQTRQYVQQYQRAYACANQIIKLFEKHSSKTL